MAVLALTCPVPATADTGHALAPVSSTTSSRSFPAMRVARRIRSGEAVSTANDDGTWGGIESLDVTRSETAEKQTAPVPPAASRAGAREPLDAGRGTGAAIAEYASGFVGYPYVYGGTTPDGWDCSGFVQYAYSMFGIGLPRTAAAQAASGMPVGSLDEALPGDIIANAGHSGIYLGNGLVVNALNPYQGTQITGLGVYQGGYAIRRII